MGTVRGRKRITGGTMRAKVWPLLHRCVEDGIAYGYRRAFKHTNKPTEADIFAAIEGAIMNEVAEWFDIPTDDLP